MNARYRVELSQTERAELMALLSGGRHAARNLKRAQILLAADAGASDVDIATNVRVGGSTVYRIKRRFVLGNLEAALREEPRPEPAPEALGQRGSLAGGDGPLEPTRGTCPVDPGTAGHLVRLTEPRASPGRPCAGAWPKTTSSPGARTCGASRSSTASTSPAWRMYSTSMPKSPIRRSSVSTRARPSSSARPASRASPVNSYSVKGPVLEG